MHGTGPMRVHSAVISILAGHVFPKLPFSLRWRLWVFDFCRILNSYVQLVPRRKPFSLLGQEPQELPQIVAAATA